MRFTSGSSNVDENGTKEEAQAGEEAHPLPNFKAGLSQQQVKEEV